MEGFLPPKLHCEYSTDIKVTTIVYSAIWDRNYCGEKVTVSSDGKVVTAEDSWNSVLAKPVMRFGIHFIEVEFFNTDGISQYTFIMVPLYWLKYLRDKIGVATRAAFKKNQGNLLLHGIFAWSTRLTQQCRSLLDVLSKWSGHSWGWRVQNIRSENCVPVYNWNENRFSDQNYRIYHQRRIFRSCSSSSPPWRLVRCNLFSLLVIRKIIEDGSDWGLLSAAFQFFCYIPN